MSTDLEALGQAIVANAAGAIETAEGTSNWLAEIVHRHPEQIGVVRDEARMLREHLPEHGEILGAQERKINEAYLRAALTRALERRATLGDFKRLVWSESDDLPGVVGSADVDVIVSQITGKGVVSP